MGGAAPLCERRAKLCVQTRLVILAQQADRWVVQRVAQRVAHCTTREVARDRLLRGRREQLHARRLNVLWGGQSIAADGSDAPSA